MRNLEADSNGKIYSLSGLALYIFDKEDADKVERLIQYAYDVDKSLEEAEAYFLKNSMNFLSLGPDYDIAYDRITELTDIADVFIVSNSLGSVAMNAMYEFLNSCMIKRKTDEIQILDLQKMKDTIDNIDMSYIVDTDFSRLSFCIKELKKIINDTNPNDIVYYTPQGVYWFLESMTDINTVVKIG